MNRKEGKINWRGLFSGDPEHVTVVYAEDGRTLATDRYSVWNLTAVCEAQGIDVPRPGRYRAMVKELRQVDPDPLLPANNLAALFDLRTGGIESDPANRLAVSEWSDFRHRPVIHTRTADVRRMGVEWDNLPRIGTGTYWVSCKDWDTVNVAVCWGMFEQAPFGAVQLVGTPLADEKTGRDIWNMEPGLARAFATAVEGMSWEVVAARYPLKR